MVGPDKEARVNRAGRLPRAQIAGLKRQSGGHGQLLALMMGTMLVIGLAILLQLTLTSTAEGYQDRLRADAGPAIDHSLSGPRNSMWATELSTYTVWLPYIVKSFGLPNGPFGAQIYVVDPISVERMSEMGTAWVRLPFSWNDLEPENTTPENYDWSASFEEGLALLSAHHIQVILLIGDNPLWAATYRNGPVDPEDLGELTEFMQALVARYSQPPYNVKYWEMYNEPDNGDPDFAEPPWNAGYFGDDPEAYVDILEAVYQPIKAVDPEAKVLLGGLAYDLWEPDGPFVEDFLDQVLINGGAAYFDLMNFHYYLVFQANWEPWGYDILGKLAYLRDKMAEYEVDKPVVCTETGWFTNPNAGGSDEVQSRYVVQSFVRSMTADLSLVVWFTLLDSDWDPRNWGLLDIYANPKLSYYAHQTLTNQLSRAHYVGTIGAEEIGPRPIEAYRFARSGGQSIVVAWTRDNSTYDMVWPSPQVLVVDKYGGETIIYDGDDGLVDGRVHTPIGPSPVYLHLDRSGSK